MSKRPEIAPRSNKWGQAAASAAEGGKPSRYTSEQWDSPEFLQQETKNTQQQSVASSRRALQRLHEASAIGEENLNKLNAQSEQLYQMERKLQDTSETAKVSSVKADALTSLNRFFMIPAFGVRRTV
jgi:hypothetical protein